MAQPGDGELKALLLTNEFPPSVYGGAGIHVGELAAKLRRRVALDVRTFGTHDEAAPGWRVRGYPPAHDLSAADERMRGAWAAVSRDVAMAADPVDADLVHCHTWYVHLAGLLVRHAYGIPLAITVHSLEPLRPWKREQLGGGYDLSTWIERTALETADAVVAVSRGTHDDVLRLFDVRPERVHVIHNGIDPDFYAPDPSIDALERHGVDPSVAYVLFVGRITRQKGIVHLVRALRHLDPEIGVVLCAGQPDTRELAREVAEGVEEARRHRSNLVWIPEMVSRTDVRQLYSHAAVFVCPSVYEPFGIINLEAMACETPVVASAVGGIPEVVVDGETGVLVPLELSPDEPMSPAHPDVFARDLAAAIERLMADPELRRRMGRAGRRRAVERFSWSAIADQTVALYRSLVSA
ncbi:MAG TPA: glycogen synthase [candidate division Zixibacteria bacterium]|nr:glycogen synthase [candidate division Zixibacteria bacterium]